VSETGSTNADLVLAARHGAAEQVLVAEHQTAGRGRLGRTWEMPAGAGLLCSVLVRPRLGLADAHLVTVAAGLAVLDAARDVAGVSAALKWPNDCVMVGVGADGGDRKLAGVLSESVLVGDRLDALVVGIGLNVNWAGRLPDELAGLATSLDAHAGGPVDREALLVAMLRSFGRHLARAESVLDAPSLRDEARARSATVGRRVRVELADGTVEGTATDLTTAGHLVVVDDDGRSHELAVGDVVHLRPQGSGTAE